MQPLIDAASSPTVRKLIDDYLDHDEVEGIALGVHARYVSMYRNEHGQEVAINEVLASEHPPRGWAALCSASGRPSNTSPIYVVIYVRSDPVEFRRKFQVPEIATPGNFQLIVEQKGRFVGMADRRRHRPDIQGGISVGNAGMSTAGTLGGFLADKSTGTNYLMSCNHVLYNSSSVNVVQQGRGDGGTAPADNVGSSSHVIPLNTPTGFTSTSGYNRVDATLAEVDTSTVGVNTSIRIVGAVRSIEPAAKVSIGQDVVFVGKESDRIEARVYRFIARVKVTLSGTTYLFGDVFEVESRTYLYIGTLSQAGDSGSWVLDEAAAEGNAFYGTLFAGVGSFALCCFAEYVMDELNALTRSGFRLA